MSRDKQEIHYKDEEELVNTITALRDEIKRLKEQRYLLIADVKKLRVERARLIERAKTLREYLASLRSKKNELVEEIRDLRQKRKELFTRIDSILDELEETKRVASQVGPYARRSISSIMKRIEELEWKQQTSILSLEEERRIIEEISRLEAILEKMLQARQLLNTLTEKRAELVSLRLQVKSIGREIKARGDRIGKLNEEIKRIRSELDELSNRIDSLKKQIEELSSEIDTLQNIISEKMSLLQSLNEELRNLRISRTKSKLEAIYRDRREKIRKKLERGEPLTIDELQLLYSDSLEELGPEDVKNDSKSQKTARTSG